MIASVSRRHVLGGSAAGANLLGSAAAGKAADCDAELLALGAALERQHAAIETVEGDMLALYVTDPTDPLTGFDERLDRMGDAFWGLADRIGDTPARTAEGLRVKARALRHVFLRLEEDDGGSVSRHVLGLVRNMVGEDRS